MAGSSRVVPRSLRNALVFAALASAFGLFSVSEIESRALPVYSATAPDLDLAVVDGITKADTGAHGLPAGNIRAVVVPHHLAASEAIALGVRSLASSSPRIVVIISPDHFDRCPKLACTTRGAYETFFGRVPVADTEVKDLLTHRGIIAESGLFSDEHGVYGIVPFVKHYLPQALVVPLAISERGEGTPESRAELVSALDRLVARNDVALVLSTDFSHYLPLPEANDADRLSRSVFCSGDGADILALKNPSQSDCPICLWIAEQEARKNGFWNPSFAWHSNSAELLHDASVRETTSHFVFLLSDAQSGTSCSEK